MAAGAVGVLMNGSDPSTLAAGVKGGSRLRSVRFLSILDEGGKPIVLVNGVADGVIWDEMEL